MSIFDRLLSTVRKPTGRAETTPAQPGAPVERRQRKRVNARWGTLLSDPFEAVRREIESQFNGNGQARPTRNEFHRYGALSCWEDEGHYFLQMDVPGLKIEDLDVSLEKGQLTIRGERKSPEHGQKTWYDERAYGSFQRTVMLTEAVDAGSIDKMQTGMRVKAKWREQREGHINDIECFVPEASV